MKTNQKIAFIVGLVFLLVPFQVMAQDTGTGEVSVEDQKAQALEKAQDTLDRLDDMLAKLDSLYQSADPEKQTDLQRDINEISRLREIVEKAKQDLDSCDTQECITDQETLIDISDQQAQERMEDVGAAVGDTAVYDGQSGREVVYDDEMMGDDPMNQTGDPQDAIQPTFYDEASGSDEPSQGNTGSLNDGSGDDDGQNNSCANGGTWPNCVWDSMDNIPPVSPE